MSNTTTLPEGQILIKNARIGYPKLFTAVAMANDPTSKPRFGCQIYLPKSDESAKAKIDLEISRISKIHFKGIKPKSKDLFIKDEYTAGCWIISANRSEIQGRPQVVDRSRKPIDSSDASEVYAGCYCNFLISIYRPKKGNTNQISACLEIVQKAKDGEPFGAARAKADEVMPELGDDEEEEFEA
jgi:hypothetical protein